MVRKERKQKGLDKFDMIPENRDVRTWVSAYYVCRSEIAISMLQTQLFFLQNYYYLNFHFFLSYGDICINLTP